MASNPLAFKDASGWTWVCKLDVGSLQKIRDGFGYDAVDHPEETPEGFFDWVGILYLTLEEQIEKAGLTPEAFAKRLDGEAFERAISAWFEGLVAFIMPQHPIKARMLATQVKRMREWMEAGAEIVDAAAGLEFTDLLGSPE